MVCSLVAVNRPRPCPPQDYFNLQQLMEEASSSRDAARTSAVVSALVQHIMLSWREHFARAVAMKFNCFFLMPFVDDFPFYLRQVNDDSLLFYEDVLHFYLERTKSAEKPRLSFFFFFPLFPKG